MASDYARSAGPTGAVDTARFDNAERCRIQGDEAPLTGLLGLDSGPVQHAHPDRAGHAGAVVGAVAIGVLEQILLVVVLALDK
jgi:hypothetical protein